MDILINEDISLPGWKMFKSEALNREFHSRNYIRPE